MSFARAVLIGTAVTAASGQAQEQLAGSYRLESNELQAQVTTWGEDCGPRPESRSDPTHPDVEVRVQGAQLAIALPDRTARTDACWSPNPGVRVASTSASPTTWSVECRTAEGDPKRERGLYTLIARPNGALELVEESEYDWQLKASHCVAKVRIAQRLVPQATASASAPEPVAEPAPKAKCTPGPLARLRLRPREAQVAPGERVCFTLRGFDAAGCPVEIDQSELRWILNPPEGATGTFARGCFKAAERAAEAEGRFELTVSSGDLREQSMIAVASVDLSDITARRGTRADDPPAAEDDDEGMIAEFGIEAAVKRSAASLPLALAALLLGCVAALAWFIHRRGQTRRQSASPHARARRGSSPSHDARSELTKPAVHAAQPGASRDGPAPVGAEQLICPSCRLGYPAGTTRCAADGSALIPYTEFLERARAAEGRPRTCQACGTQLAAGALFCGACGRQVRT